MRTGKVFELSLPLGSTGPQLRGDASDSTLHFHGVITADVAAAIEPNTALAAEQASGREQKIPVVFGSNSDLAKKALEQQQ